MAAIGFGLLWSAVCCLSVYLHLTGIGWQENSALWSAIAPYGPGAFAGGTLGLWVVRRFGLRRPLPAAAALFAFVLVLTLVFTLIGFFVPLRAYFAEWHEAPFTVTWAFQAFFTALGSTYLFLATGIRPLVPWGFLALLLLSIAFSGGWTHRVR